MEPVKLLALDLDGTLLNSQKELTLRTRDALYAAAGAGVEIVPTTGRFFTGMPEVIQKLPSTAFTNGTGSPAVRLRWKRRCGSWSISTASP